MVSNQKCIPKLIGGDVELGNFILGEDVAAGMSDFEASRRLLNEVKGMPRSLRQNYDYALEAPASQYNGGKTYWGSNSFSSSTSRDLGRRWLCTNGGVIYIDLNHIELATMEVLSARDYTAGWQAMLRIARQAQVSANEKLAPGKRIVVLANNSDRQGNSYGGHLNCLMTRLAWDDMMRHRMMPSFFNLCAYQTSSICWSGQGKVGSENGEPEVPFQLSQRADFIECLVSERTTYSRPVINTRDENLSGPDSRPGSNPLPGDRYARLHVIFYDTNMAQVATYLKAGVLQIVLTMIEAEYLDSGLVLDNPLVALHEWSRNPDLDVRMPLISGQTVTAVELQLKFLEKARAYQAQYGFEEVVPDAEKIMDLWEDTLLKLHAGSFESLRGRIDWIMKKAIIDQALAENPDWTWRSPQINWIDQMYSSINPEDSLFHSLDAEGLFEHVVTEAEIVHFTANPPENTRAWTRAMLLRAAGPERVSRVDWDEIELQSPGNYTRPVRIQLPDPLGATRADTEDAFLSSEDFTSLLYRLENSGLVVGKDNQYLTGSTASLLNGYRNY